MAVDLIQGLQQAIVLLDNYTPDVPPPVVTTVVQRDYDWIRNVIQGKTGLRWLPMDGTYYLTDQANFMQILEWDTTNLKKYIRDKYDCENYGFSLKANVDRYFHLNQVGFVLDYSGEHGYNCIIFPNGQLWLIEPQSDSLFFLTNRNKDVYPMNEGYILL